MTLISYNFWPLHDRTLKVTKTSNLKITLSLIKVILTIPRNPVTNSLNVGLHQVTITAASVSRTARVGAKYFRFWVTKTDAGRRVKSSGIGTEPLRLSPVRSWDRQRYKYKLIKTVNPWHSAAEVGGCSVKVQWVNHFIITDYCDNPDQLNKSLGLVPTHRTYQDTKSDILLRKKW